MPVPHPGAQGSPSLRSAPQGTSAGWGGDAERGDLDTAGRAGGWIPAGSKGPADTLSWAAWLWVCKCLQGRGSVTSACATPPVPGGSSPAPQLCSLGTGWNIEVRSFWKFLMWIFPTAAAPEASKEESIESQIGKAVGKSDVWFRFNEGVSNAVRRNLYIRDLL